MSSRTLVCALLSLGCGAEHVSPRAQILLFVDTNAPLVGQVTTSSELPGVIAVDTLSIQHLDAEGKVIETRELVAPDPRDFPISFGVVSSETVRFRLRAFRAENAYASDSGALTPDRNLALDRLLELTPRSTFERRLVVLDVACFNAPASFSGDWSSCVDAEHLAEAPSAGLLQVSGMPATLVGTSALASSVACSGAAPSGAVCIAGGAGQLGDQDAALIALGGNAQPVPTRVIYLSPFFLDRTEVSVGQYRALARLGTLEGDAPEQRDAGAASLDACTYQGSERATNDALPLNCIGYDSAREYCQALGGDLPTEAQWEFAARGRGWAQPFPWGSAFPECCTASIERSDPNGETTECGSFGAGVAPVGSFASGDCSVLDVSRDGVLDLGGNLTEWTRDKFRPYEHACWAGRGILRDPECVDAMASAHPHRGSYYNASFATTLAVLRDSASAGDTLGFRCAYPDGAGR
jgi:formylglycine-generating enzyme required for sulfatase activity